MIRLFVTQALSHGAAIALAPDQARYLTIVMRQAVGAEVVLFNGADGEWRAWLTEVSKRGCILAVDAQIQAQPPGCELDLVIALVKRARLEIIVEKATELGVGRIRLVTTRRTNADHTNVSRLQAIATEAAEQTGRLDVPAVLAPEKLERVLDHWEPGRSLMFCDEAGDDPGQAWGGALGRAKPALDALKGASGGAWSLLIGPEGGFAPEERQRLRAFEGVTPVTLGPRILRSDTAVIAALTLWQSVLGDWTGGGVRAPPP